MATDTDNPLLPPAFVESLAGTAEETLREWLKCNTPPAVADLFDNYIALKYYNAMVAQNEPAELLERHGIQDIATGAVREINDLGGAFRGVDGQKFSADNFKAPLAA